MPEPDPVPEAVLPLSEPPGAAGVSEKDEVNAAPDWINAWASAASICVMSSRVQYLPVIVQAMES